MTGLMRISMQGQDAEFTTEGLPKAFLHSLRTLFDILDDGRRGYVHISEIESRWQGAEAQDLPGGVLQSLRRVTPPHGCLTFERFVAGLRSSILNPDKTQHHPPPPPLPQKQLIHANGFKVRPLGPSNGTNTAHAHTQNRSRQQYDNRNCPGVYTTSSKASSSYPNPSAQPCARSGRGLERVQVAPERAPDRTDSIRGARKSQQQQQQQPTRVQSVESIPSEPFHNSSKLFSICSHTTPNSLMHALTNGLIN